jgi:hypothetical protein
MSLVTIAAMGVYQRQATLRPSLVKVTSKYNYPSLIISHKTSDGQLYSPVTGVHIFNDKLDYITVTSMHHLSYKNCIFRKDLRCH